MLRRKKLAILRRQRSATQKMLDDIAETKAKKVEAIERKKLEKRLKEWRKADFKRRYQEAFGDCQLHEPKATWADGPTTKSRSVLENY